MNTSFTNSNTREVANVYATQVNLTGVMAKCNLWG